MKSRILKETFIFSSMAILAPILLFGGLGFILDRVVGTEKVFLLSSLGVSFLVTQILMFKKVKAFSKVANSYSKPVTGEGSAVTKDQGNTAAQ